MVHPKLKTLIPMHEIEDEAQKQIYNILNLPFLERLAVMPDVHYGFYMPIGSVALFEGVISPACVGVDIGCGMTSVFLDVNAEDIRKDAQKIAEEIYKRIPVGFQSRNIPKDYDEFKLSVPNKNIQKRVNDKIYHQIGTLGGGNHFIEVGESEKTGKVVITIHSGSRGAGKIVADYYINFSKQLDKDLPDGFFGWGSEPALAYWADMNFFTEYALVSRRIMADEVAKILGVRSFKEYTDEINENHNFADSVRINDKVYFSHRKGVTPAKFGQMGVIPANMRDGVYITKGLGNKEFLESASHGAGRVMSRSMAKKLIPIEGFKQIMSESGVIAKVDESTLDESPMAYKNIDVVLEYQNGINIEVVDKVKPIINIKG